MRFAFFYHSLVSDWNHGNAHFLRGIVTELLERGHEVRVFEPSNGWSRRNLLHDAGEEALREFASAYPQLSSFQYGPELDLDVALDGVDVVLVHEWNEPQLVARIGKHRVRNGSYVLLFHDTHHRAATAPQQMAAYDLCGYDAVLAFGEVIRNIYLDQGWTAQAYTWHEAADVRTFRPQSDCDQYGDLVWVGNWGDGERSEELRRYLLEPVAQLGLLATVHGVRYPVHAKRALATAGVHYAGWLPNYKVPETFSRFRVTVHIPRRPYVQALPGIPTIRPFEAMACGIPLVSSYWEDTDGLFNENHDYLVARTPVEMRHHLRSVLADPSLAQDLSRNARRTILERHTCGHRVDELLSFCAELGIQESTRIQRYA